MLNNYLEENYIGETAALTAALLWATSSLVYTRLGQKIAPLTLNLYKGLLAIVYLIITLLIQRQAFTSLSLSAWGLLALSGVIGIGLGDTAYFAALNSLGARRTLLLETASPPLGAFLALVLIGEQLSAYAWCGILLTILGIAWVISERNPAQHGQAPVTEEGLFWGIFAALAQALGAVISRFALLQSEISPLESALIRLVGGTVIVILLLWRRQQVGHSPASKASWQLSRNSLQIIAIAAFGSTYLGIWLQQTSLKYAPTGIAQTFLATSPLFILPLVLLQGERVSLRSYLGVVVALVGIALVFSA